MHSELSNHFSMNSFLSYSSQRFFFKTFYFIHLSLLLSSLKVIQEMWRIIYVILVQVLKQELLNKIKYLLFMSYNNSIIFPFIFLYYFNKLTISSEIYHNSFHFLANIEHNYFFNKLIITNLSILIFHPLRGRDNKFKIITLSYYY